MYKEIVDAEQVNNIYPIQVDVREKINLEDLLAVIDGKILAIRVKNFCDENVCSEISNKLLTHQDRTAFNKAYDINRVGMAHFEIDSQDKFVKYHENAIKSTETLREVFGPYISPADKIRLILEEIWPSGAHLETIHGRKCFVGICRIMEPAIELLAHNDRLDRDSPESQKAVSLLAQLSACTYLQVPDVGGELLLWSFGPKDENEYIRLKGGNYGISLGDIPSPDYVLQPKRGDLVIFNARKFHAVSQGSGRERINIGVFIGYRGINYPLSYWS